MSRLACIQEQKDKENLTDVKRHMQHENHNSSRIGENRIREAFEFAASGMAITDLDGHFQETNAAYQQIVGRIQQELDQSTILSITHEDDRENCRRHLQRLVSGELTSFVLEKRYVRPNGQHVFVRNSFSLLRDGRGLPSHIILICNDVSDQRRAERLLLEREKLAAVGQLASTIAHEINNPLEAVLNLLYLVNTAETLDRARTFASQAEVEVQRAAQIATQTLQFHRQQSKPTPTNLAELLESVLILFKGKLRLGETDVRLEKRDEPQLICYPGEIRQVLANLIRNAIEALPKRGRLHIRVRPSTDWRTGTPGVRVTIADTGHGMSAATRRHIYDPFFTTKGALGSGLGLWVSAGILAKHGGYMRLRSSDIAGSSGTAFTLVFPQTGAEGKAPGPGEGPKPVEITEDQGTGSETHFEQTGSTLMRRSPGYRDQEYSLGRGDIR